MIELSFIIFSKRKSAKMLIMGNNQYTTQTSRTKWIKSFVRNRLPSFLFEYIDDVCQEIMIKLIRADKRQGEKIMNFGYIKQTSMSVIIDFMRKHKNSQQIGRAHV